MASCGTAWWPGSLPTSTTSARRATPSLASPSSTPRAPSRSATMTSAASRARSPRIVRSPGSPGPAPTSVTRPGAAPVAGAVTRASLEQAAAAEHPSLERGEDDELDEDADGEDHEDRREHAREVGELAALVEHRAEAEADRAADRDDLGGHQRAPRERPALLEARDVPGQRGRQHDERRETAGTRAEHGAHAAQLRRHLVDARDESVHDRRHGAHEHDEVHRGIREAEPDDRGRHPRDRRQHLQARDDRPDRPAERHHLGEQQPEGRADDDRDEEAEHAALEARRDGELQAAGLPCLRRSRRRRRAGRARCRAEAGRSRRRAATRR